MLYEKIHLNKLYPLENDPYIEIIVPFNKVNMTREKSKAIIIVPGGAYLIVSGTEADPVALSYMLEGFITIVFHYSVKTAYPAPMNELACAIDYLRKNNEKYYIDKDKISIIGFSAGGHLTACYGYLYKHPEFLIRNDCPSMIHSLNSGLYPEVDMCRLLRELNAPENHL